MDWTALPFIDQQTVSMAIWATGVANVVLFGFVEWRLQRRLAPSPADAGLTTPTLARQSRNQEAENGEENWLVARFLYLFGRQTRAIRDGWARGALWIMRLLFPVWLVLLVLTYVAPPAWS